MWCSKPFFILEDHLKTNSKSTEASHGLRWTLDQDLLIIKIMNILVLALLLSNPVQDGFKMLVSQKESI